MKWLAKLLAGLGIAVVSLCILVSFSLLLVWRAPSLLLNQSILKWGLRLAAPELSFSWKRLDLTVLESSWSHKRLLIQGVAVCFANASQEPLSTCVDDVSIDVSLKLTVKAWSVVFHRLNINGVKAEQTVLTAQQDGTEQDNITALLGYARWLEHISFEDVFVKLTQVRLGQLSLAAGKLAPEFVNYSGRLIAKRTEPGKLSKWDAVIRVEKIVRRATGSSVSLSATVAPGESGSVNFSLTADASVGAKRYQAKLRGENKARRTLAVVSGKFPLDGVIVEPSACQLSYQPDRAGVGKIAAQCPVKLTVQHDPQRTSVLSSEFTTHLSANADWIHNTLPGRLDVEATLQSDSVLVNTDILRSRLRSKISVDLADVERSLLVDSKLELGLAHFDRLVSALENTRLAIPAPLAELSGRVDLHCSFNGDPLGNELKIPCNADTALSSKRQKLVVKSDGELRFKKSELDSVSWTVRTQDVQIALPFISMRSVPRLGADPRISVLPPERQLTTASNKIRYDLHIVVDPNRPVRFLSNLTRSTIPIVANLHITDQVPLTGSLRIASVDLDLFRRDAHLRHLRFKFTPRLDQSEVDGQLQVVYTDYTVDIAIMGQLGQPQVQFTSTPPLPERDVMAVLLFGRTLDSLSSVEAESVGSARSAIADGAVSLASMYLLASTPIESIGYDPASGALSARLRLSDGTSFHIGTDMSAVQRVGVRRHLARNWYLSTFLQNPFESVGQTLTTFLEWSIGY